MRRSRYTSVIVGMAIAMTGSLPAIAQSITPDATLGNEASTVVPNGDARDDIEGGAVRGQNVFHSFSDFNVGENREVYFISPNNSIQNIVTRVTGNNPTNIQGTLGTEGGANPNLFLLNPNGIMFGKNARLDLEGSFFATTGSGIRFGEAGDFSAVSPQAPGVLTVNPSALLFNQIEAQAIVNESQSESIDAGRSNSLAGPVGLEVPDGETLALIGGDISLVNGNLTALGGRIEIGSIGAGSVNLNSGNTEWKVNYDDALRFNEIIISQNSVIDASGIEPGFVALEGEFITQDSSAILVDNLGENLFKGQIRVSAEDEFLLDTGASLLSRTTSGKSGDIEIESNFFEMRDNSSISVSTFGSGDAGSISLDTKNINISSNSELQALTNEDSSGKAGIINIEGDKLQLSSGSKITSTSFGLGDAGEILLDLDEKLEMSGASELSAESQQTESQGRGGSIFLETDDLEMISGSQISVATFSEGNAGTLRVDAKEAILSGVNTLISSQTEGKGNAGNIDINGERLEIADEARITSITFGDGDSGDLSIDVNDVNIDSASIEVSVEDKNARGDGGELSIDSQNIVLENQANITANTLGEGNAGKIDINADSLRILSQSQIGSATDTTGNAGEITINAGELILSGFNSSIFAQPRENATGNGGAVKIEGQSLLIEDGAFISVTTDASGNAGNLDISADSVILQGFGSGLFARVSPSDSTGIGGNIDIQGNNLEISQNAGINTSTNGRSKAGDINLDIKEQILVEQGGTIAAETTGDGNAGNLNVMTNRFNLNGEGSFISTSTSARGTGGNVDLRARNIKVTNGGQLAIVTQGSGNAGNLRILDSEQVEIGSLGRIVLQSGSSGQGGQLTINTDNFNLFSEGVLSTSIFNQGSGRQALINANSINLDEGSLLASIVGEDAAGSASNLKINTRELSITGGAGILMTNFGSGQSGELEINADEFIRLDGLASRIDSSLTSSGNGSDVNIETTSLELSDGAVITATSSGAGNAGALNIEAEDSIRLTGRNVLILPDGSERDFPTAIASSALAEGNGGNLNILTKTLKLSDSATINGSTSGSGKGGTINISATESVALDGINTIRLIGEQGVFEDGRPTSIESAVSSGGEGGDINILTQQLEVSDSATVNGSTFSDGNAGSISIDATEILIRDKGTIAAGVFIDSSGTSRPIFPTGNGGTIDILGSRVKIQSGGSISVASEGFGNAGVVEIRASEILEVSNSGSEISASTFKDGESGNGGILNILDTGKLVVSNFGRINSQSVQGDGDAGNLTIEAIQIQVLEDGKISTGTSSSGDGGNLTISGNQLQVLSGSEISTSTDGLGNGGILSIDGVQTVLVDGSGSILSADTLSPLNGGNGGLILISNIGILTVSNDGDISSATFGDGNGGNISIIAKELNLTAPDESFIFPRNTDDDIGSLISTQTLGRGQGGNITIESEQLNITDSIRADGFGAELSTISLDSGNAGNISVKAGSVNIVGSDSLITSNSEFPAIGNAGDITISPLTDRNSALSQIRLSEEAVISSNAVDNGDGGDIFIESSSLILESGTNIVTITNGSGISGNIGVVADSISVSNASGLATQSQFGASNNGGNLTIEAQTVNISDSGFVSVTTESSGNAGVLNLTAQTVEIDGSDSGLFARVNNADATGSGGQLSVQAEQLKITNNAEITSSSLGEGDAGNITLSVRDRLNVKNAKITTESEQSAGGDIDIEANDIELRQGSQLTASVFGGEGGGGNINSVSQTFLAFEDSDILAFADRGNGGNITIQTPVFLADLFPDGSSGGDVDLSDFSQFFGNGRVDINASSRFGLSGTIEISDEGLTKNALVPLASDFSRGDLVVAGSCLARQNADRGSFVVTGTGGLPRSPYETLRSPYQAVAVRPLEEAIANQPNPAVPPSAQAWIVGDPIQEASSVFKTSDGRTLLSSTLPVASTPEPAHHLVCP